MTVTSDMLPTQRRTSATQLMDTGSVVDGSVSTTTTLAGTSLQVTTTSSTRHQTPATAASGAAEAHIVHPVSGEKLTLHAAMVGELVDLTSGTLTHPTTGEKMPFSEAVERGYVSPALVHHLETPCGIIDPATGKELTLLQATKKGMYSPEEGSFKDPTTGQLLSPEKAAKLGFIILEKVSFFTQLCVPVVASLTLYDAIVEGHVNVRTGEFTVPTSGEKIPLTQAFAKGFVSAEPAPVATSGISLSEAVNQGFIDDFSGQAVDRNSGNKYTLDEAIQKGLLASHVREIVNSDTGCKLTVAEAIQEGVLDVTAGRYVNNVTEKKLKFSEAVQQQLICRPYTLKDCSDMKLLDSKGEIQDPQIKDHIPLLEAVGKGIVDVELKSVKDTASKTLLTLPEAFMFSVLLPEGKYRDTESGVVMSLLEAVNKGLITSVSTKTIFDIDGIKDPESGEYISFKVALHKGIIDSQTGMFTDPRTGNTMTLEEAVEAKRIQPQILETLKMNIGMFDSNGKEMNVVEAVLNGHLDPNTGQVLDPKTGNAVALEDAVRRKIITPEGAATLRGLLSVTVTTATITKTIKRYVTVKSTGVLTTESRVTLQEAQHRGLINEAQGTFQDPESGATLPLDEAIERGLVTLSTEWPASLPTVQATSPESPTRETTKRHLSPDKPHSPIKAARTSVSPEKEQSPERPSRRGSGSMSPSKAEKETVEGRTSPVKTVSSASPDRRSSPTKSSRPTSPSKSPRSSPVKDSSQPEAMDTKPSNIRPDTLFEAQNGSKEGSPVKSLSESPSKSTSSRQMSPFTLSREASPIKSFGSRADSPMKSSGIGPESPLKTDESMPTSPDKGLIKDQVMSPERPPRKGKSTIKSPADSVDSAMGIVDDLTSSGASLTGSTSAFTDSYSIKTRILELPPDGWYLKEAIEEKLYDPVMGLFTIPGTDRLVSFEECVNMGIIDPRSGEAIDPKSGRKISLMRAIEKGVLDSTGKYPDENNTERRLTMKEAISKKCVLLKDRTEVTEQPSGRVIQITSVEGQPDKVQVFDGEGEVANTVTEIKTNEPAVDDTYVEIKPGITFHPTEGNVHMEDGSVVDVVTAVKEGKIQPTGVKVRDPYSGRDLNISEAMRKGIIDKDSGEYKDKTGRKLSLTDAAKYGILGVAAVVGAPVIAGVAAAQAIKKGIKKIKKVDPKTGTEIVIEESVEIISESPREEESEVPVVGRHSRTTIKSTTVVETDVILQDPVTGKEISPEEAISRGLISPDELEEIRDSAQGKIQEVQETSSDGKFKIQETKEYKVIGLEDSKTEPKKVIEDAAVKSIQDRKSPASPEKLSREASPEKRTKSPASPEKLSREASPEKRTKSPASPEKLSREASPEKRTKSPTKSPASEVSSGAQPCEARPQPGDDDTSIRSPEESKDVLSPTDKPDSSSVTEKVKPEALQGLPSSDTEMKDVSESKISPAKDERESEMKDASRPKVSPVKDQPPSEISPVKDQPSEMSPVKDQPSEMSPVKDQPSSKMSPVKDEPVSEMEDVSRPSLSPVKDVSPTSTGESPNEPQTDRKLSLGERTRERVTTEPKFSVAIGRAKSLPSPSHEGKPVMLQKVRRKSMKPKQAASKGVVDEKTATLLEDLGTLRGHGGEPLSLEEALRLKRVDGDSGAIVDIACGEPLTINEAVESGILDSSTGSVLVPIGRSVTLPEAVLQGLFDKTTQRFIHPETGDMLTLREAVLCDVIDPVSQILEPDSNQVITLDEAIKRGLIDSESGQVNTKHGPVSILEAMDSDMFVTSAVARVDWLPPLGMTFPVALERGLVDADTKEVIHPVTSDRQPLKKAIENNFILALPCPILPDSVQVTQALECKLINTDLCTFTVPSTGEEIPVEKAVESGMLQIKPMTTVVADEKEEGIIVTETITSYETIITKTIQVKAGHVMVNQTEVKNTTTGEIIPLEEAKKSGIVVEIEETEETKETPTFREAVEQGHVDFASGTFKDPNTSREVPIAEAIQQGLVQPTDPAPSTEVTSKINIMQAFSTIYHEKSGKFKDPASGSLLTLDEAVEKGVIDPDAMVYDTKSGDALTTKEAVEKGVIDVEAGNFIDPKSGSKIKVKDAVKMGLLAVIGAPILAGMAVKEVIKGAREKVKKTSSPTRTTVITEIVEEYVTATTAEEMLNRTSIRPEDQRCYPVIKIGQQMTLRRAMEEGYIDVDLCVVVVPSSGSRQLLRRSVTEGSITLTTVIEIRTRTEIWIVEETTIITMVVKSLDPAVMTEKGEFDPKEGKFIDPVTKDPITFHEALEKCSLNPDHTVVTDPTTGEEITLAEAIKEGIVDPITGEIRDPQTGSSVPFFEAVKKDLVKPDDKKERKKEQEKPDTSITINEAVTCGLLKPETGMFTNPATGESMILGQAIQSGLLDPTSIQIVDPRSEETVSLKEAVETGLIDLDSATFTDPETGCEVEFTTALMKGILVPKRKPMSLVAVVKKDLYDAKSGKITDTLMKQKLEVDEAVKRGIVEPFITLCKDTKANKYVTLDDALDCDLVIAQNGKLKNTKKNTFITFDTAVEQELIVTKRKPVPLTEAVMSDMYEPQKGLFYDPCEGTELTLNSSISCKLVDGSPCKVKVNEEVYTVSDALDKAILDGEAGRLLQPDVMTLDEAVRKGYVITSIGSLSLQQVLEDGLYDPETGLITVNGDRITIKEAIEKGIIDPSSMSVKDPRTGEPLSLEEAIRVGIIDPESGTFRDPVTGADIELTEALSKGMIIEGRTKFTLYQTVTKGLYNPSTGRITAPISQSHMTVSRAIRSGLVDPNTTLARDPDTEQLMSFKQGVSKELIDTNAGVMRFGRIKRVNFKDAFEQDYLLDAQMPMALRVVIMKELYKEESGRFLNPTTGSWITLSEAISVQIIDPDSTHVKDTLSGRLKKVNLREAIEANIIDGETALVKNYQTDTWHTLLEAYELTLIVDSRVAMSLQRALHQGLVDDDQGLITDVNTGRNITLHEAMRRLVINPGLPCYLDHTTSNCLSLVQTCREGIIDRRLGKFIDPKSGCTLTLMDALEHGMILDIDKPQDLYGAVTMGFCDSKTGRMIQPNTGRRLTLADACKQSVVDPTTSIIRVADKPKFMKLSFAVKEGLIDDIKGKYIMPDTKKEITLEEATKRHLILPAKRPLTVEEALQYGLYSPDTGRFTEPSVGDKMDMQEAITHGLIDGNTSALKNPSDNSMKSIRSAIEDKDIDAVKGVVIHPQTKKVYTINVAFEKELIVTVGKPISFMQAVKQGSIDFEKGSYTDPETSIEYTLEEALRFELIDPDSAVIKDPNTGRYKTLKRAVQEGLVDLKKRALYDPQSGTLKTLCIIFDQGTIVFLREPLSFDEAIDKGHFDTETGMYTDPNSKEILTLKETCHLGLIDPQTVLIKNTRYRQLLQPAEACQVGALDVEKGKVCNTASNQQLTMAAAMDAGLIVTPRRGMALLEALDYNLYDTESGCLLNPHVKEHVTLQKAVTCGLIDSTTTMVKCPVQGTIQTMCDAVRNGVLDEQAGAVVDTAQGTRYPLPEARRLGYLLTAQARVRCTSNCALGMTLHSKITTANALCVF